MNTSSNVGEAVKQASHNMVSIVLPVYNQADHIAGLVRAYEEVILRTGLSHEFILVTNACRDNSVAVCRDLSANDPNIRTVNSEKGGWGLAVRLGLKEACGNILCYTNSARTTPADLQLLVIYGVANPESVVKAHRISREAFRRRFGSLIYNLGGRMLFKLPTWDINATPKVFPRSIYEAVDLQSAGDLIDLEFFVKCKALGKVVLEVPVYSLHRHGGKSTTNYRSAIRMYLGAFRLWQDFRCRTGVFSNFRSA